MARPGRMPFFSRALYQKHTQKEVALWQESRASILTVRKDQ